MQTLFYLHSGLRWVVVLLALLLLVWTLLAWRTNRTEDALTSPLLSAYSAVLGIQVVVGLIYLIWMGAAGAGYPLYRIEHLVTMLVATAIAGIAARWKNAPIPERARNTFLAVLVSLILVYVGVMRLPQGW